MGIGLKCLWGELWSLCWGCWSGGGSCHLYPDGMHWRWWWRRCEARSGQLQACSGDRDDVRVQQGNGDERADDNSLNCEGDQHRPAVAGLKEGRGLDKRCFEHGGTSVGLAFAWEG